ncbi:MAG TPA: transcriptional regulator [Vicinamibacterales bacterium]|nr:transcriptional regulator [Vicinamibacterales bacterium]
MTDLDRVIHEPARLLIVALLAGVKGADFLWIQRESGLTKGNLSSHLSKLEEAGYVEIEKTYKGKVPLTLLRLTKQGMGAFEAYRKNMNGLLARTGARS